MDNFQHNGSTMLTDTFTVVPESLFETLTVDTLVDENDGDFSAGDLSLREAFALSNVQEGADTINFDASLNGGTIVFDSSLERELAINDSLSIVGLGQDNLTLDGGFIFDIAQSNIDVSIDDLNLKGGTIDNSGNLTFSKSTISQTLNINGSSDYYAIISREGNATIIDSTIKDNNGGSNVGVVIESGTATIENSAITGNDSLSYGQSGIIIRSEATVDISNSTIANNKGRTNAGIENAGIVNITNSTIVNNSGGLASGGLKNFNGGTATVTSSIIANNTGYRGTGDVSGDGEFVSGGYNLISNGDDAVGFVNGVYGDLVGTNGDDPENPQNDGLIAPQLGELQNNGGYTQTYALLIGSPAIDAGNPDFEPPPEFDQRGVGFPRVLDGDGDGIATIDIGAFEFINIIDGTSGNDLLIGTHRSDRISGFNGNDLLTGRDSDDILDGGAGNDRLFGNDGYDSLVGGDGLDVIVGSRGDDLLDGGADDDSLFGGRDADQFVLRQGDGRDTIFDYRDGTDSFLLADGLTFEDLRITQGIGQSLISVTDTSEDLAVLFGVNANDLGAEDFSVLV